MSPSLKEDMKVQFGKRDPNGGHTYYTCKIVASVQKTCTGSVVTELWLLCPFAIRYIAKCNVPNVISSVFSRDYCG